MSARQAKAEHQEIYAEAQDVIDALGRVLMQVQQAAQVGPVKPGAIDALFRDAHTLKGLYGLLGGKARVAAAHAVEDLLDDMRMGRQAADKHSLDALFTCVEAFANDAREAGTDEARSEASFVALVARLGRSRDFANPDADAGAAAAKASVVRAAGAAAVAPVASAPELPAVPPELAGLLTAYEAHRFAEVRKAGLPVVVVAVDLPLSRCEELLKEVQNRLAALGEVLTLLPSAQASAHNGEGGEEPALRFAIYLSTQEPGERLSQAMAEALGGIQAPVYVEAGRGSSAPASTPVQLTDATILAAVAAADASPLARAALQPVEGLKEGFVGAGREGAGPPETAAGAGPAAADAPLTQTVRVDIRRLDKLMHWVNELSLTKIALQELGVALRREPGLVGFAIDLQREGYALERRLAELQAGVMAVRMVPLAQLFERLVRSGHQAAHELGKEIRFVVRGETTEVDKFVAEKLVDPLLHLVRNAVDHAIEYGSERRSLGKEPYGTIQLSATTRGSQVVVQVQDDGQGIDRARILQLAIERGLLGQAQAAHAVDADVWRLMCAPGFSTRQEVGQFSGRGVGLDVVKTQLERLSGSLDITSEQGRGSTFVLAAPLTLAIIPALVLTVGGEQFAVPVTHVVETVALDDDNRLTAHGQLMLRGEGAPIPMVYLAAHLALCASEAARNQAQYALIVAVGTERVALAIDDIQGQQDIIVKSLGPRLRKARGFAGASELASKKVVLVIDTPALLHEVIDLHHAGAYGVAPKAPTAAASGLTPKNAASEARPLQLRGAP